MRRQCRTTLELTKNDPAIWERAVLASTASGTCCAGSIWASDSKLPHTAWWSSRCRSPRRARPHPTLGARRCCSAAPSSRTARGGCLIAQPNTARNIGQRRFVMALSAVADGMAHEVHLVVEDGRMDTGHVPASRRGAGWRRGRCRRGRRCRARPDSARSAELTWQPVIRQRNKPRVDVGHQRVMRMRVRLRTASAGRFATMIRLASCRDTRRCRIGQRRLPSGRPRRRCR
jgi:hypothetical protein